jgi:hypothetical protein
MKSFILEFLFYLGLSGLLFICIIALIFVAPWSDPVSRQMFLEILLIAYAMFALLILLLGGFRYWSERRKSPRANLSFGSQRIESIGGTIDMQKWEYCQVIAYGSKRDKESGEIFRDKILQISGPGILENLRGEEADINKVLNRLGAEGWEGFGHSSYGLRYSVLLKRPVST